ncbi:hypothetical protein Tcan_06261 [Toxocara canis]|uniref:Uncharacterized protein n=1 Tax=Toxocara canis TaxID=6265 RepID=A0A0B2VJ11_TOXCA|nr:hypothetical protein Tcan_06261 [Toxocara canis]
MSYALPTKGAAGQCIAGEVVRGFVFEFISCFGLSSVVLCLSENEMNVCECGMEMQRMFARRRGSRIVDERIVVTVGDNHSRWFYDTFCASAERAINNGFVYFYLEFTEECGMEMQRMFARRRGSRIVDERIVVTVGDNHSRWFYDTFCASAERAINNGVWNGDAKDVGKTSGFPYC